MKANKENNENIIEKQNMPKERIDERTKSLKYVSILSVIILLVIVILFNVVVDKILGDKLKFDFSTTGQNSVSDTTKSYLDTLPADANIRIVGLFELPDTYTATPLEYIVPLLEDYQAQSNGRITVEYIDPTTYPYIITELDPTGVFDIKDMAGYYAVCYNGNIKTINPSEDCFIYENRYNPNVGYETSYPVSNISESAFTNAIINLVEGYANKTYIIQDQRQGDSNQKLISMLTSLGINTDILNYGDTDFTIPSDCDLLILNSLSYDVTEHMAEEMNAYLSRGGKMIVTTDYTLSISTDFTNLNTRVLNERGLNIDNYMIIENDTNYMLGDNVNSFAFMCQTYNDTYTNLGGSNVYSTQYPVSVSKITTKYESSINCEPVLVTSSQATRLVYDPATGLNQYGAANTFNIAMVSRGNSAGNPFELYVIGSDTFSSDDYITSYNDPNVIFFRNLIKSTLKLDNSYDIASKNLANYSIDTAKTTMNKASAIIVILVVVIPLSLVIAGTIVYTKRKHL